MKNFKYTDDSKRYHTLNYFYRHKFGEKVMKISLNGNFTCPNIDGTKGYGGCIYCSKTGSGEYGGNINESLTEQFENVKKMLHKKWKNAKYVGYFQARTNTYKPVNELKKMYEEILSLDNVVGLNIATRSDAISNECLEYLEELNKKTYLVVELGLQTIHEKTAKLINRCHTLENFTEMVKKLRKRNINVVVHIINGLPYETEEDMLQTIKYINNLDIQGVKIHMLSITKDTKLAKMYKEKPFHILTRDEYTDIIVKELELLREEIVINRITGDPKKDDLIEPFWLTKKWEVLNEIDKKLKEKNTYQGRLVTKIVK